MCLAVPAQIKKMKGQSAEIEAMGVSKTVDVSLLPDARVGDYVIVHAGFAIQLVDPEDALATQGYWKEFFDE